MTQSQLSTDLPLVTREEFAQITCNRCGDCCESLYLRLADFDVIDQPPSSSDPEEARYRSWLGDLVPVTPVEEIDGEAYRRFRCLRFQREPTTGLGVCTRYDDRPWTCAAFPYGRPVVDVSDRGLPRCSWAVRIRD